MVWAWPINLFPWTVTRREIKTKQKNLSVCLSDCLSSMCSSINLSIHLLFVHLSIHFISYIHTSIHWVSVTFLFLQDINIISYCSSCPCILALDLHKPVFQLFSGCLHDLITYSKQLPFSLSQPARFYACSHKPSIGTGVWFRLWDVRKASLRK